MKNYLCTEFLFYDTPLYGLVTLKFKFEWHFLVQFLSQEIHFYIKNYNILKSTLLQGAEVLWFFFLLRTI